MNPPILRRLFGIALLTGLCSCATSSLKRTWISPDYTGGPVKSVAVVVVADRPEVRQILEGQFSYQLEQRGHPAVRVGQLMSLEEMKADREATAAKFREAGATSVMIVKLVGSEMRLNETQETAHRYGMVATGDEGFGWYGYYLTSLTDMAVVRSNLRADLFLETSLHDLVSGRRLWAGVTQTKLGENTDRLEEVEPLVSALIAGMRKDGVIK